MVHFQEKLTLKLTHSEMRAFIGIIEAYMRKPFQPSVTMLINLYQLYNVYEKKLRPKMILTKKSYSVKLDVAQAYSIMQASMIVELPQDSYEEAVSLMIRTQIHKWFS